MKIDVRRENKNIQLVPFGDIHYGDKSCNWNKTQKMIDWIKSENNTRVILMGDLLNSATKTSVGAAVFDEDSHGQDQLDFMIDALRPIRKKIYGALVGNHEERCYNSTGYDPIKLLCYELHTNHYGYGQFIKIKGKNTNYSIYATHGSSSSTLPYTKIKGCLNLAMHKDADIYLMGHVHDLQLHTQEVERIQYNQVVKDKRYFVLTGHYLNYDNSYAEMKNLIPSKQGSPVIDLNMSEKQIRVKI
ncbi:MAG: metallophosphoesterase [Acholeplasmataceae bacterium]|nr:metallophosphoesterase [Acholeplasmataceae bacterium]